MIIFSDPHLGLRRTQNTTPASRQRLQDLGFAAVQEIVEMADDDFLICAGDLFDSYSNPEGVIARALPLVEKLDWCLAGNHDLVNIADRIGSLQLLRDLYDADVYADGNPGDRARFCYTPFGQVRLYTRGYGDKLFVAVPHVADQDLFDKALQRAFEEYVTELEHKKYLLLHCNYDNPMSRETDLNLTREAAEELLDVYDYILLGHEHEPREDFDGRLVVIGNTLPTGFADVSDKRVLRVEPDGSLTSLPIWHQHKHYLRVDWKQIDNVTVPSDLQFLRLTGKAEASELVALSRVTRRLWAEHPYLLALKADVEVAGIARSVGEQGVLDRLPEIIARELKGSALEALWTELRAEEETGKALSRKAG